MAADAAEPYDPYDDEPAAAEEDGYGPEHEYDEYDEGDHWDGDR